MKYWHDIARHWNRLGHPLRPGAPDVQIVSDLINRWNATIAPPRGLVLGATPELYETPWPRGSNVIAADHTPAMLEQVWPGPKESGVCAEWTNLPTSIGPRDVVLCDGGLNVLSYPLGLQQLAISLAPVIPRGGIFIFRLYVSALVAETPEQVLADFLAGRIANLNALKLRIWTALHENVTDGVELAAVWNAIHRVAPDPETLAAQLGWPADHLRALDAYRDNHERYYFPSEAEVRQIFCAQPGGFEFLDSRRPSYPLGDRCPILALRRV